MDKRFCWFFCGLFFAVVLAAALLTELSPVVFVLTAGVLGIVIRMMGVRE